MGARVEIIGDWGQQIRDIKSGVSYGIANSLFANFGLGTSSTVDNIIVTWPSGIKEEFDSFNGNQQVVLVEGTGTAIVGINELENQLSVSVFPNPANELIQVQLENVLGSKPLNGVIRVIDQKGKQVLAQSFSSTLIELDVSFIKAGTYILDIILGPGLNSTRKIVIN